MLFFYLALFLVPVGIAFYFWQQRKDLLAVLNEGAKGYEELTRKNKNFEKRSSNLESEIVELKNKLEQNRQTINQLQTQSSKDQMDFDLQYKAIERKLRDTESQRDHILKSFESKNEVAFQNSTQAETLQAKVIDLESKNRILEQDLKAAEIIANAQTKAKTSELQSNIQKLERELKLYRSFIGPNPKDFETMKRKAGQYEKLYYAMKGLRDMADERNTNWESALKELSTWVLKSSSAAKPNDPILSQGIGPIVGEALQRIGATLVREDIIESLASEKQALKDLEKIENDTLTDPSKEFSPMDSALPATNLTSTGVDASHG